MPTGKGRSGSARTRTSWMEPMLLAACRGGGTQGLPGGSHEHALATAAGGAGGRGARRGRRLRGRRRRRSVDHVQDGGGAAGAAVAGTGGRGAGGGSRE